MNQKSLKLVVRVFRRIQLFSLLLIMLLGSVYSVYSQQVTISGSTSVTQNYSYNYYVSVPGSVNNYYWGAYTGQVTSAGSTYATVKWTHAGNQTLYYDADSYYDYYYGSLSVSVTGTGPTTPANPTISSSGECAGQATLKRSGSPPSGVTWYWQGKNSNGTSTSKGSGTYFTANEGSGYYYIRARNSSGQWSSGSGKRYVTISNPAPAPETSDGTNGCGSSEMVMYANTIPQTQDPITGASHRWYTSSTGSSYITPTVVSSGDWNLTTSHTVTSSSTFWVSTRLGSCESERVRVDATYVPSTTPTLTLSKQEDNLCDGSATFHLTAAGGASGSTYKWYASSSGGSALHTGSFYQPTVAYSETNGGSKTFYVGGTLKDAGGCSHTISPRKSITVTVNPIPGLASGSNKSRCGTGTVTLTASPGSNGNTIRWYSASSGGTLLHTGTSYQTPSLSSNKTYYAASYNSGTGCLDGDRKAITAVINPIPGLASGSNKSRCGTGTVTLTASPGSNGNTIRWYSASSGGTLLHTGTSYQTPSLSSNKTYYAASYNSGTGCLDGDRKAITAVINPIPGLASGSNKSRCGTGTVTLTASPGSNGNTIRWYSASSGGTLLHTGTSYQTPSLSSSKTYYAASYNSGTGCLDGDRKAITAVINPIPGLASGSNKSRCGTGTVTLTASPGSNGNTIRWYSASSGGTLLHTGTSYQTPSLSSNKTYYAASYNSGTGCLDGDRKAITAVINPIPGLASGSNTSRCGTGTVTLTASPGSNGNTIRWYSASSGGTLLHTGTSYQTPSLSSNKTYYAASYNSGTGCLDGDRKAITAVINPIPGLASGSNTSRCGTGTVTLTASPGSNGNTIRWYSASSGGTLLHTGTSYQTPSLSSSTTYYAASYNSGTGCLDGDRKAITAVINSIPGLASGSNTSRCGTGTVTLTASPGSNGNTIRWYSASSGGTLLHTGTSYQTPSLSSSTTYYAASYNSGTGCLDGDRKAITAIINSIPTVSAGPDITTFSTSSISLTGSPSGGTWSGPGISGSTFNAASAGIGNHTVTYSYTNGSGCSDSDTRTITVNSNPDIQLSGPTTLYTGETVTLSVPSGYSGYQWRRNTQNISGATGNIYVASESGDYQVSITANSGAIYLTSSVRVEKEYSSLDQNHIITHTFKKAGIDPDDIPDDINSVNRTINYFDGLGRPMQQVVWNASPNQEDLIQPILYDQYGRSPVDLLPYIDGNTGEYQTNAADLDPINHQSTAQFDFYQNAGKVAHDTHPYGVKVFEPSPLNRVLKQGASGTSWQPDQDPAVTTDKVVRFNYSTNASGEVKQWDIISNAPVSTIDYGVGQLQKMVTEDEEGHGVVEYTDKLGRTVLKKVETGDTSDPWAQTYYIYDDLGNLRFVLPPKIFEGNTSLETGELDALGFQYTYDHRNRMIEKKVPGSGWVHMVYDNRDRLVLTQDANQRPDLEWTFTKYDALNRPVSTGTYTHGSQVNQETMQGIVDAFYVASEGNADEWYEVRGAMVHGYTDQSFPKGIAANDYLTVTYYDDYAWNSDQNFYYSNPSLSQLFNGVTYNSELSENTAVKGQITGGLVKNLSDNSWLKSVNYYDERYRVIQVVGDNNLGEIDITSNLYDFTGKVLKTKTVHNYVTGSNSITRTFDYDHAGRLLTVNHQVDSGPEITLLSNEYNELGELVDKGLHSIMGEQVEFVAGDFSSYGGSQDADVNAWNIENNRTLKIGDGNTWKKMAFDYDIQSSTVISFEFKSSTEGEIHGIGLTNNNSLDQGKTFKLYGTQTWGIEDFNDYSGGEWKSYEIPIGQYYTGAMTYLIFANDHDGGSKNANSYYRNIKIYESTEVPVLAQSVDYRYNIRGWLTSMNNASLVPDVNNDDDNDYFGFELLYNEVNGDLSNTSAFNGNISAMLWSDLQSVDGVQERAYGYGYDPMNRLKSAQHHTKTTGTFGSVNSFSVTDLNYDLNGNIKSLTKKGTGGGAIDALVYNYENSEKSNRLRKVEDGVSNDLGFKDGADVTTEYEYDDNGNMIKDRNKGIDAIHYNHLNLPYLLEMETPGDYIEYTYDAAGIKLQQKVFEGGTLVKTTDYVGEFIYETQGTGTRELQFIQHEEGRIVPETEMVYQYHLKDHLGNVRTTFTTKTYTSGYLATMEDVNNAQESQDFYNLEPRVPYPVGGKAVRLNSSAPIGPGLALAVSKGDTIDMSVVAYYEDATGWGTNSAPLATLAGALTTAYGGMNGGTEGQQLIYDVFNSFAGGAIAIGGTSDETHPAAYLNYLVFDSEYNLTGQEGYVGMPEGANLEWTLSAEDLIIEQAGYVYIYVSNESTSNQYVYFDNLDVAISESPILESSDYYPFGLTFNSYTKPGTTVQKYKYNGKELQEETQWHDFGERMYDPSLGRWFIVDRLAINHVDMSPYNYALNNPIRYVDPDGATPWDILQAAMGYLKTPYQWSGKNPYYIGGAPGNVNMKRINIGMKNNVHWSEALYGKNFQNYVVDEYEIYRANGANVPENYDCGVDCSGFATIAFNSDPDKLMDDFSIYDGANKQKEKFKEASLGPIGKGELHKDFNRLIMGDLVFMEYKNGYAHHVMVATGKAKYDSDGNVIEFQVIHSKGGVGVTYDWYVVGDQFSIGHSYRQNENDTTLTYNHNGWGMSWNQLYSWILMKNLWNKISD